MDVNQNNTQVFFLVNLLQDINIIRPLVYLVATEFDVPIVFLVSDKFIQRDKQQNWQQELDQISEQVNAEIHIYDSEFSAYTVLQLKHGVIFAASESHLSAHSHVHNIFRIAPSSFLKITLQHGFECVGFLQNREHNKAHGKEITFGADVVCGWSELEKMKSLTKSEISKYYMTGPTARLPISPRFTLNTKIKLLPGLSGLVCENLHSVRLGSESKQSFMDIFFEFCKYLHQNNKEVGLRPHPGGQYIVKNKIELPDNVHLNNSPIYKVDLTQFQYGISAPSSVVIDMLLAGIPVAVWQDKEKSIDTRNYEGLTIISELNDWVAFAQDVIGQPEKILERQTNFLKQSGLLVDPQEVFARFSNLLSNGLGLKSKKNISIASKDNHDQPSKSERVFFVANGYIPTLQLSFYKPLTVEDRMHNPVLHLLTGIEITQKVNDEGLDQDQVKEWLNQGINDFCPTIIVFCRFSDCFGKVFAKHIVEIAKQRSIPVLYHIDDDLLNIPIEIGIKKYKTHNSPNRLTSVRYLLSHVDLVYCSTFPLLNRIRELGLHSRMVAGDIYCSGQVLIPAKNRTIRKIGYMGFDHSHDFSFVLPVLVNVLLKHKDISFELFGSIPKPDELEQFGDRVKVIAPIPDYNDFLAKFAELSWDIGICPLATTTFNTVKANTKWVEYTSVGAAVIATKGMAYDDCCSDECGELVTTLDEWESAIDKLCTDDRYRYELVKAAQNKLEKEYSLSTLRKQVEGFFQQAHEFQQQSNKNVNSFSVLGNNYGQTSKADETERILFVANSFIPTLQLSFYKPLSLENVGKNPVLQFLNGEEIRKKIKNSKITVNQIKSWIDQVIEGFEPSIIVFCRYSHGFTEYIVKFAKENDIPVLFHIDDDLLNVPLSIGEGKHKLHNDPKRLASIRYLLGHSDLVYCSTPLLMQRFKELDFQTPMVAGKIYCSGQVLKSAVLRPVRKIGYMGGGDHKCDLEIVLPVLVDLLSRHQNIIFELFGIPKPAELEQFGNRVTVVPPVSNYNDFLAKFTELDWDIGICPLLNTPFHRVKANTKWVEYTSVGAAVIATRGMAYDECCSGGCGELVESRNEWASALERLCSDSKLRYDQVCAAQQRLTKEYSISRLRLQVEEVFQQVKELSNQVKERM